jgi:hypothetical protein
MTDAGSKKSGIIWDPDKKRPSNLTIIFMIALTIIFLVSGLISAFASFHDIEIRISSDGEISGNINFDYNYHSISRGSGDRVFSYNIRIGTKVTMYIYRSSSGFGNPSITAPSVFIKIFDNGILVQERSFMISSNRIELEHTVGDY